jgi:hypothetical protein
MPINLLSLGDVSASEIRFLLRLAAELKSASVRQPAGAAEGRNIALISKRIQPGHAPGSRWRPTITAPM